MFQYHYSCYTNPRELWPANARGNDGRSTRTRLGHRGKRRFRVLLHDLCRRLPVRERAGGWLGPKPHLPSDAVFAMAYKVYCGLSARRFTTDLHEAHGMGFLSKQFHGMKATTFAEDSYYTPILKELVGYSARPLRSLEQDFAIDSSGFGSTKYERWYDQKYGITRTRCVWVKTHIASGVKTNVVTAVRILDKDAHDSPQFVPLVKETKRHFSISEVSADKAYGSLENFEAVNLVEVLEEYEAPKTSESAAAAQAADS
jgi:hypothetical protein